LKLVDFSIVEDSVLVKVADVKYPAQRDDATGFQRLYAVVKFQRSGKATGGETKSPVL
jgi:hypothetical protein